ARNSMIDVAERIRTWLSRGGVLTPPESIESSSRLKCDCGFEITTQREERGRMVVCAECGAKHYVLAASRWPQGFPPRGQMAIDWEPVGDEPPSEREPAIEPPPVVVQRESPRLAPEPVAVVEEKPEDAPPVLVERVRRRPLRWIVLGAIVLI